MSSPIEITTKGFGTMSMTWTPNPPPLEQSIKTLKYVKDKYGVKFFNTAEFYHFDPEFHNLKLISQFLSQEKDVSDIILSIKAGYVAATKTMESSNEFIDQSIQQIQHWFKDLKTKPKIIYELARVSDRPIEESISHIYEHVKAGAIDGISLSEVSAESIRKAVKVAPISFIEVEVSLFSQDIFHNGVLEEASKYHIPIVAYSPLARGILTDYAAEHEDFLGSISKDDFRSHFDRFSPETYEKNNHRLQKLYKFAKTKNVALESLAISYLESLEGRNFSGVEHITRIIPIPSGSTTDKIDKNFNTIKLSNDDLKEIEAIVEETEIHGYRYNATLEGTLCK